MKITERRFRVLIGERLHVGTLVVLGQHEHEGVGIERILHPVDRAVLAVLQQPYYRSAVDSIERLGMHLLYS
jgi:hypothetical protein